MLFKLSLLSLAIVAINAQQDFQAVERGKQCPIARVDRYEYTCQQEGWIQNPSVLRNHRGVDGETSCAKLCFATEKCQAFRLVQDAGRCILYSKRLENMYTVYDNYQPGLLYDRYCFSTNCNAIAACKARDACDTIGAYAGSYYSLGVTRFACTYGYTSQTYGERYKEFYFDKSLKMCQAIRKCVDKYPTGFKAYLGAIDLHYHLASDKWVCRLYKETQYAYYDSYFYLGDVQHMIPQRFTVKNKTVGAAFGYWISSVYRDD